MQVLNGFEATVGNTPLIRLSGLSEATGCDILGKAEFLNPGGSVKDRAALWMIRDAEASGALRPGGTVVEGTAGNTGIGLAHICNARGYRCIIYMPDNQSQEKVDLLRTLGAAILQGILFIMIGLAILLKKRNDQKVFEASGRASPSLP